MAFDLTNRLVRLGVPTELAKELGGAISGDGIAITSDQVAVGPITAPEFSFGGGTLTQFCQAIADAIPAA